jgi:hypothetical protein
MKVYDRWWPEEIGTIHRISASRWVVEFPTRDVVYDRAHLQFLEVYVVGRKAKSKRQSHTLTKRKVRSQEKKSDSVRDIMLGRAGRRQYGVGLAR